MTSKIKGRSTPSGCWSHPGNAPQYYLDDWTFTPHSPALTYRLFSSFYPPPSLLSLSFLSIAGSLPWFAVFPILFLFLLSFFTLYSKCLSFPSLLYNFLYFIFLYVFSSNLTSSFPSFLPCFSLRFAYFHFSQCLCYSLPSISPFLHSPCSQVLGFYTALTECCERSHTHTFTGSNTKSQPR